MNLEELKAELKIVKRKIFLESMADFMNWSKYNELYKRKLELMDAINAIEKGN